jgi:hypothetical protein
MSYTRLKTRDANRWGKKYPFIRVRKVPVLVGDKETWIEAAVIHFVGASTATYHFDQKFPAAPIVTATAVDAGNLDIANVNIFISSVDKYTVVIGSSQILTGTVTLQAIYVAE